MKKQLKNFCEIVIYFLFVYAQMMCRYISANASRRIVVHYNSFRASFSQQFHSKMRPNVIPVNNKKGKRLHCQALQKV